MRKSLVYYRSTFSNTVVVPGSLKPGFGKYSISYRPSSWVISRPRLRDTDVAGSIRIAPDITRVIPTNGANGRVRTTIIHLWPSENSADSRWSPLQRTSSYTYTHGIHYWQYVCIGGNNNLYSVILLPAPPNTVPDDPLLPPPRHPPRLCRALSPAISTRCVRK